MSSGVPATRLYFIVARKSPVAVVFRRGPTRHVELLTWDLESDQLTAGQWLKGRIYERRSDLTPTGDKLIYFAAKCATPMKTWTAISRPPYLTALALWPKGDAWGGGGLFDTGRRIRLNHRPDEMTLGDGFRLAPWMRVDPCGDWSGRGEDQPIHDARLRRDGWQVVQERVHEKDQKAGAPVSIKFEPPIRYRRTLGSESDGIILEMSIEAVGERDGSWYVSTYRLKADRRVIRDLERADWADRAPNGDLLLARAGSLFRLSAAGRTDWADGSLREVANLSAHRFEERKAPVWATTW
jgi:hypothetical protein